MRYHLRLAVTLRLIMFSLFAPLTSCPSTASSLPTGPSGVVSPDALLFMLRNSELFPAFTGGATLVVEGAFSCSAPFVLFRLKRWGFSECRIRAEREVLCIDLRR